MSSKKPPKRQIAAQLSGDGFIEAPDYRHGEGSHNRSQAFIEDFAKTTRDDLVKAAMFVAESDSALVMSVATDMAAAPPEVAIAALRNVFLWKASEVLPEIQAPMKLINSDKAPTNMEAAERYGVEVLLMSGVGHFIMMEDPETFNRLLAKVIEEF